MKKSSVLCSCRITFGRMPGDDACINGIIRGFACSQREASVHYGSPSGTKFSDHPLEGMGGSTLYPPG